MNFDDYFIEWLKEHHRGERNAVSMKEAARTFNVTTRETRAHVHQLRIWGYPICSGQAGYWYAANVADVKRTIRFLDSYISKLASARRGLAYYVEMEG